MIFWSEKSGKWQKTGKNGHFFYFLGPKMGQKIFLAIFLNNVFEGPYKDAFYQKLANFNQNWGFAYTFCKNSKSQIP